jgi:hypothetical protein
MTLLGPATGGLLDWLLITRQHTALGGTPVRKARGYSLTIQLKTEDP